MGDGAKSDLGNMLDLFDRDNTVLIPDPVYPVYVDTNVMDGRPIVYLDATEENGFLPLPDPGRRADLIYLCSPNNPTGAAYNKEQLQAWVDYALEQKAVLLYDAAYEAFITELGCPTPFLRSPGRSSAPWSSAPSPKPRALPACAAATPSSPGSCASAGFPGETVAAAAGVQVQRRQLPDPAGGPGGLHPRGPAADQRGHRLLPGKRPG